MNEPPPNMNDDANDAMKNEAPKNGNDERYLWDRSGEPDPTVRALENLLAPLAHDDRALAMPARRSRARVVVLLAAGLAAAAIALVAIPRLVREPPLAPESAPIRIAQGSALKQGEWFTATAPEQALELGGDLGRLTFAQGSRVQVRRLADDETKLYLERGELHALVSARARPRFFQVETPATTCVDLGCKYTLTVDEAGAATVIVTLGRVVFENDGRDVYVPARATCRARRETGSGTPRFIDSPKELASALDAFDAAARAPADERRTLARAVFAAVAIPHHTLALWHMLQDRDDAIAIEARAAIARVCGAKDALPATRPDAAERERWRTMLVAFW